MNDCWPQTVARAGDRYKRNVGECLIGNLDLPPTLLRNDTPGGAWLTVVCEGPNGGPPPIGTLVTVRAGGRSQSRDVAASDSYASTHDPRLHFGLGGSERAETVDVRWPDGTHTVLRDVKARQFLSVGRP
jgi:hypothetical protein